MKEIGDVGNVDTNNPNCTVGSLVPHSFLIIFHGSYRKKHLKLSFEPDSYCGPVGLIDFNVSNSYTLK